ncbi:hypothetical protein CPT_Mano_031 [Achromobacter phage Mano]|uniref:Uncharacterized protein n=1 Tax=Achromobacter phage Mano TaxID=2767570 RepID=A0A7L8G6A5_9CAUD|nr:hypothetical protein KB680_gp60 [Achromobacter phage Mano]QOE32763.1 hypothetical protein CPT_Mano_031 [Achromobacter phage Mano]
MIAKELHTGVLLDAPGYEKLAGVFGRAFHQAAYGKGKERHANAQPFHEQVMQTGAQRFGTGALLFQAFKKSEESQRLPHDRAVAELLGAMVYLAGAVIALERQHQTQVPANDNVPQPAFGQTCCKESGGCCTECPRNG